MCWWEGKQASWGHLQRIQYQNSSHQYWKLGDKGPADAKGKLHQPQDSASSETIIQPWISLQLEKACKQQQKPGAG